MKKFTLLLILFGLYFNVSANIDTLSVNISNDTTLTADTIYVSQAITVQSGVTLTINPGVVMLFKGDASNFNSNQGSQAAYILVKGNFVAEGEADNRIKFTAENISEKWGGILFPQGATASVKYSDFSYVNKIDSVENVNYTGALSFQNDSNIVISCSFSNNTTGVYAHNSKLAIFNGIFNDNITAVKADTSVVYVYSTTIADNVNGVYLSDLSTGNVVNSIVYGNTSNQFNGNGSFNVQYSDIEGGYTGSGNASFDPQFKSDYTLNPCSQLINIGSSDTQYLLDNKDFFGKDRVFWTLVDMGAYEHQYVHSYVGSDTSKYSICGGDSVLVDGTWYTHDTTFINTFNNAVNYCDSTIVIEIEEHEVPTLSFQYDNPEDSIVCLGKYSKVTAVISPEDPNATYSWASSDTSENLIVLNNINCKMKMDDINKMYYCEVQSNGCTVKDSVAADVYPPVQFYLGNDTSVCRGYVISAEPGMASYEWSNGYYDNALEVVESGTYSVTVFDNNNCRNVSPTVNITVKASPVVDFIEDTIKIYEDGFTILGGASGDIDTYTWSTGETTPTINVDASQLSVGNHTYWLRCEYTSSGCVASDTVIVTVMEGVGVNELETTKAINIYPNPANNNFNITGEFVNQGNVSVSLTDINGKIISINNLGKTSVINEKIDVSDLDKGMYFVKIVYNDKVAIYKLSIR